MVRSFAAFIAAIPLIAVPVPAFASPARSDPPYVAPAGLTATDVTFENGDTSLSGSVVRRTDLDPAQKHPAVVLVHGSGNVTRVSVAEEAEAFARAGIIALIYDKRSGYSKTNRDFSALADDARAGVDLLQHTAGVDPSRVGLWGLSEGGWVAPLAASRSEGVAFLITIGASGHTPARTQAWNLSNRLPRAGVAASTAEAIVTTGMGMAVAFGQFPAASYDPVPVLRQIKQPVLAIWGERDVQVPPRESAEIFQHELTESPNVSIRFLAGAEHTGRVTTNGYDRVGGPVIDGRPSGELSPAYADLMTSWVTTMDRRIDPLPAQAHSSVAIRPFSGIGFVLFGLIIAGLLSWPIWSLVRRLGGGRGTPPSAWAARGLVVTGLAGAIGAVSYATWAVATQAKGITGSILGQPMPWLLLRILVAAATVCTIAVIVGAWRRRSLRLALLGSGGVLMVPFAVAVGLLQP